MSTDEAQASLDDVFPPHDRDAWLKKVEKDLRGKPYAKLSWQTEDGSELPPVLDGSDLKDLPHLDDAPSSLLRQTRTWALREVVNCPRPADAAEAASRAVEQGADQIEIALDAVALDAATPEARPEDEDDVLAQAMWTAPGTNGVAIHRQKDLERALATIDLQKTYLCFTTGEVTRPILDGLLNLAKDHGVGTKALHGELDFDPITRLCHRELEVEDDHTYRAHHVTTEHVFEEGAAIARECAEHCPGIRPIIVDGQGHHLGGASAAQEIAFIIATLTETVRGFLDHDLPIDTIAKSLTVRVQVSHDLLTEIAKLRALRLLWAKVMCAYRASEIQPRIHATSSERARAIDHDVRTNILRTSIATFAAVIGGADSISVGDFDSEIARQTKQSRAIARNQQHLLREESQLDRVADPAGGSYSVEVLTDRLARSAWKTFQEIETEGGMLAAMKSGTLNDAVVDTADARDLRFRKRQQTLVGISRYADPSREGERNAPTDEAVGEELLSVFEQGEGKTFAELARANWPTEDKVIEHHYAPVGVPDGHEYEDIRTLSKDYADDFGECPKVLLASFGALKWANARADFARDLFGVGGFPVVERGVFDSTDAIQLAVAEERAAIVVFCADDESYPSLLAETALPEGTLRVVAGKPNDTLSADYFVHIGADVVTLLSDIQQHFDIR